MTPTEAPRPGLLDLAWPLRTERLLLAPMRVEDLDDAWRYWRLPEVQEWLGVLPADRAEFGERYDEPVSGAILGVRLDQLLIGNVGVHIHDGWAQSPVRPTAAGVEAELSWVFDPAYGGQGYATEAVTAAVRLAFGPLGLRRVGAGCFADNVASWRLMERLGMRREETSLASGLHHSGRWLDGYQYALLADEWAAPLPAGSGPVGGAGPR